MLNCRRGGLLAAVSSAALVLGAFAPASAETLADAIALAYDTNPTLLAQRASQRALDESAVQARSGLRPTITGSAQGNYSESRTPGGLPGNVESNSGSASVSVSQPLLTGGRVSASISAAEADILAGQENLRRVEASILSQVIQAYVDTRRDQESLRIRQENVRVLARQLDESKARFEVGEITRTDVAQSEARYSAAVAQLSSAQAQLGNTRATYAAVVGRNPGDLAPEPSLADILPADMAQALEIAESANPAVRAAQYTEQASKARLAGARAERMPSLALRSTAGWSGVADPMNSDTWSRSVTGAAVVTIPLFTGGLTNSRVRAQIERNNVDRVGVESARRTMMLNLTQSWNQLTAARANIGSTETQVKAARIAAEGTRQEQQVGLRTTIDVLNAEQELRSAELAQVSARRDEYVASIGVLAQMGRLEARYIAAGVPVYDAAKNSRSLRVTWGWVPWEEPLALADGILTPKPKRLPLPAEDAPIPTAK